MKKLAGVFATLMLASTVISLPSKADDSVTEAQKIFKQFTDMERAFDPSLAELFAPNAVIKDIRIYQDGQNKTITWSGNDYKQVLRAGLPVAKVRNDINNYGPPNFVRDGANVRIKTTRNNLLKKTSGPFELVIAPSNINGKMQWKIVEETSQSEP